MTKKTRKGHPVLAVVLLVFSCSIAFSTYKIVREYELINKRFIPNLWVAAQAEIELLRFMNELHLYARAETANDADDLIKRLYILLSRMPILLGGSESEHVRAIEGAIATISELEAALERLEPQILSLAKGDLDAYQAIYRGLLPFQVPLHRIVASTMNMDETVAAAQRDDIRRLYWWILACFVGMVASAIILVLLLFKEITKVKGLLRIAHTAEATASAARTQLSAVIDAVPARIVARDRRGRTIFENRYRTPSGAPAEADTELPPVHDALDQQVFETEQVIPLFEEEERLDEGSTVLTWLTTKVPLRSDGETIVGVVTVSLDITQQKDGQRLNTLLATAVEHAGDVIEITDSASRFEYVNAAFERVSGYARAEALGETPFSLLMGDQANEPYYRAVQNCISEGRIWQGTLTGRRKAARCINRRRASRRFVAAVRRSPISSPSSATSPNASSRRHASGTSPITTR
jgi:PAS domain S-box-containing protein